MKQLTLRQIPEEVENELRHRASQNGASLNHTAIAALQEGLGLTPPGRQRRDLSRFAGKWTVVEADEFDRDVQAFGQIDAELWE
jgi:plasmid stability protein